MKTGQMLTSQCNACLILNLIIQETIRLLDFIYPYNQYQYKKCPASLSMQHYNYADRRHHLMYIIWPSFMILTHMYICKYLHVYIYIYIYMCAYI